MRRTFRFGAALAAAALGVTCLVAPVTARAEVLMGSGEDWANRVDSLYLDNSDQPMHRLYNRWTGEHFYTASWSERDTLVSAGWTNEGVGWIAPYTSSDYVWTDEGEVRVKLDPVYRLYNPYVAGGDHHYTMDENEYKRLQELGWRPEGVGWYSAAHGEGVTSVPIYRQYNRYAETGTHNYTTSKSENDALAKAGWKAEGVAWYGIDTGFDPSAAPTTEQRSALQTAKQIADGGSYNGVSYVGMVLALAQRNYDLSDAHYAAMNCGVDWNEQAVETARMCMSRFNMTTASALTSYMRQVGYMDDQISYALAHVGL